MKAPAFLFIGLHTIRCRAVIHLARRGQVSVRLMPGYDDLAGAGAMHYVTCIYQNVQDFFEVKCNIIFSLYNVTEIFQIT